jgi:hypothetical protein
MSSLPKFLCSLRPSGNVPGDAGARRIHIRGYHLTTTFGHLQIEEKDLPEILKIISSWDDYDSWIGKAVYRNADLVAPSPTESFVKYDKLFGQATGNNAIRAFSFPRPRIRVTSICYHDQEIRFETRGGGDELQLHVAGISSLGALAPLDYSRFHRSVFGPRQRVDFPSIPDFTEGAQWRMNTRVMGRLSLYTPIA